MRRRLLVVAVLLLPAVALCWGRAAVSQELPPPRALQDVSFDRFRLQGAGSCAAAACHNADGSGLWRREYAVALRRDPHDPRRLQDRHAQAYEVLFDDRSKLIEKNLRGLRSLDDARPERDVLCLRCHVHPGVATMPHVQRADGVGCEACHGPAEQWLASHFRYDWQSLSAEQKRQRGMRDTRSVLGRIRVCVDCHVGAPGDLEVNHDLIAAGHPRLSFEFAGYHAALHKHWDAAKDTDPARSPRGRRDFDARAWALGQLVSAQAALRLLSERAADERRPWPEFAEYDCAACHHALRPQGWRQERAGRPGQLPWGDWYYAQLPEALHALGADRSILGVLRELQAEMETPRPERDKVAVLARQGEQLLATALARWEHDADGPLPVGDLLQGIAAQASERRPRSWDAAAQTYLSLAALARAQRDQGRPAPQLPRWRELLKFPPGSADLDPAALTKTFEAIQQGAK